MIKPRYQFLAKECFVIFFVMFILQTTTKAQADEKKGKFELYHIQKLELRLNTGIFIIEPFVIYRNGRELDADFSEIFLSSPTALDYINTYSTMTTWGRALMILGPVLFITGTVLKYEINPEGIGFGIMIGGLGITIAGSILEISARPYVNKAIDAYNRDLLLRIRGS